MDSIVKYTRDYLKVGGVTLFIQVYYHFNYMNNRLTFLKVKDGL